jgi:hypothetical protein
MKYVLLLAVLAGACGGSSSGVQPLLPKPENGYQVVIGPFQVPAGHEVQLCQTLKLPNDQPVALHEIEAAKTLGSHHLILSKSDLDLPDQTFDCWGVTNWEEFQFVADVQQKLDLDWTLPDGHAIILQPHQQLMIQAHYVNATTVQTPDEGLAFMNLYTMPMEQVTNKVGSMFTVNTNIYIPPHSGFTNHRNCLFSQQVNLVGMTGHFHARGLTFDVDQLDFFQKPTQQIYQNTDWNDANFQTWDDPIFTPYGIQFSCTYFNDTDQAITWGAHADVQEHCNLFFHYTPREPGVDPSLVCKNGSGGW